MKTFKKNWNCRTIQDNGAYMSKEAKSFVRAMKNMLKRELEPYGIDILSLKAGHYYCYGFLKRNNFVVYISYDIPRCGSPINFSEGGLNGVLYREAKDDKDFTGGTNHFCSLESLPDALMGFISRNMEIRKNKEFNSISIGDYVVCLNPDNFDDMQHKLLITNTVEEDGKVHHYGIDTGCEDSTELRVDFVDKHNFLQKIDPVKIHSFFFTFGSSEHFPYKYGHVIVNANDEETAIKTFRKFYPDKNEGIVNCAFIYSDKEWIALKDRNLTMAHCHKVLNAE